MNARFHRGGLHNCRADGNWALAHSWWRQCIWPSRKP